MTATDTTPTAEVDLNRRALTWLLVATIGYVACSLIANVMSVRILRLGPDWASFSIDAGTLTYPLTFTLRDLVHKIGGRSAARVVILAGAVMNVVLALGLWAAAALPEDSLVEGPAQEWFGPVLNPVTRIVAASVIAQVLAELADTEVYHRFVLRFGHRVQWGRVLTSNLVAIPIDSVIFVAIAFGGVVPWSVAVSLVWANIAVKGLATVVSVPLIYAVPEDLQRPPVD
ncbi:MAG: queuosine precursor transporter [Actinomycetota bacterium]|nr:queuosine precursor transporter [Actinomycetota bacterium]